MKPSRLRYVVVSTIYALLLFGGIAIYVQSKATPNYTQLSRELLAADLQFFGAASDIRGSASDIDMMLAFAKTELQMLENKILINNMRPPLTKLVWHYRFKSAFNGCVNKLELASTINTTTALRTWATSCGDALASLY